MSGSVTIKEFCAAHRISRTTFNELQKRGEGPVIMRIGRVIRISDEAENAWRRAMEERSASARLGVRGAQRASTS